jgi:hypothetical protein
MYSRTSLNPYPSVDGPGYGLLGGMGSRRCAKNRLKNGSFSMGNKSLCTIIHRCSLKIVSLKAALLVTDPHGKDDKGEW